MRFRSLLILLFAVPGLAWTQTTPDAGFCQSVAGTYDERIAACSRAITLGNLSPEHVAALVHIRGMTWYYKGDYDHAIADYNETIRRQRHSSCPVERQT